MPDSSGNAAEGDEPSAEADGRRILYSADGLFLGLVDGALFGGASGHRSGQHGVWPEQATERATSRSTGGDNNEQDTGK